MKRACARGIALLLACVLCIAGCDNEAAQEAENGPSCVELAHAIADSQTDLPELTELTAASDTWSDWLDSVYRIDPEQIVDGCVLYGEGSNSDEIVVLIASETSFVSGIGDKLAEYVQRRRNTFSGYAPDEEFQLSNAEIVSTGPYVALLAVPDASSAKSAFRNAFDGAAGDEPVSAQAAVTATPEPTPAESDVLTTPEPSVQDELQVAQPSAQSEESAAPSAEISEAVAEQTPEADEYDHDAVLVAWQAQDSSSLSGQNLAVYEKAAQILNEVTTPDMSAYDKELAVHNYLTEHIHYDPKAQERHVTADADPTSSSPYGALVLDTAICYGYSSSFQLLMDMLGIECVTVNGTINDDSEPHSWNMVNLDGNWYHVDVGWDDPTGGTPYLVFFNRASNDEIMRLYNRQWDEAAYPQALGGPLAGPQF